ncbi:pantoate--beta-alanine ligase [Yonghaparkia sp. Root332]|uniref:pantoate--beta-alanine ligase n=1 Tax=Yonghaparkia sp. Root332 TaxID=1736516 RepID=UPI0006F423D0|nr:pantoate--beta-alanine ligase [Yonghaparkia sp. Root332]KQV25753.1 pantoate--beta-alanine ligase [Yonghaparkia sp. Root332]
MSRTPPPVDTTIDGLRARLDAERAAGRTVALVPTMGSLHEGHLALVDRAAALADAVVVSIFVNPLQFGPSEDYDRYPRDLTADLAALTDRGVAVVFAPTVAEMYPRGPIGTRVSAGAVGEILDGASRPGHFDGMLTVVAKLLLIAAPDVAVFGEKDAQQVFLVQRMVRDLDVPTRIDVVETVRASDGLALSSRNAYLSPEQRTAALALPSALAAARAAAIAGAGLPTALEAALAVLDAEPLLELDYVAVVDPETFQPAEPGHTGAARALVAARVGSTRLIDTHLLHLA